MKYSCEKLFFLWIIFMMSCSHTQSDMELPNRFCDNLLENKKLDNVSYECVCAGQSFENRPVECMVIGEGQETILIIAAIHGDERAGSKLVWRLASHLKQFPKIIEGRTIVIMPQANPDGIKRGSRYNARGVDVNRNFDTSNRINSSQHGLFPLSEPETRILVNVIEKYQPIRIISIHQPLGCIDYDGPAQALAFRISEFCHLPICKLGEKPGSLGTYAGIELGIPIITFELPYEAEVLHTEALWNQYGFALVAFILSSGHE